MASLLGIVSFIGTSTLAYRAVVKPLVITATSFYYLGTGPVGYATALAVWWWS
jgi:hypothetical protein